MKKKAGLESGAYRVDTDVFSLKNVLSSNFLGHFGFREME